MLTVEERAATIKGIATFITQHGRPMSKQERDAIIAKRFPTAEEHQQFLNYMWSPEGTTEMGKYLHP